MSKSLRATESIASTPVFPDLCTAQAADATALETGTSAIVTKLKACKTL